MKNHFNDLIDDKEDLGEILYGDVEAFVDKVNELNEDEKKTYVDELYRTEIIAETWKIDESRHINKCDLHIRREFQES